MMARAWGNDAFARLDHWDDIERAAALHDEGWRGWEEDPPVGADGEPIDFPDVAREVHIELYRAGIAAAAAASMRAGLLVSMHGSGLYEARFGLGGTGPPGSGHPPAVRRFLDEQRRWRERITARLGAGVAAWAWDAYRLLQAWDALSLYLVWRARPAGRDGELRSVPRAPGDREGARIALRPRGERDCELDPWPFAGSEARLPVRTRPLRAGHPRGGLPRDELHLALPARPG